MTDENAWTLDPRLAQDSISLGDLPLSRVLLMNDANYPWLILVPRRPNLIELIDLDDAGQMTLMAEVARAARALKEVTTCDKLNVAALGNTVRQLHVHVIARRNGDPAGARARHAEHRRRSVHAGRRCRNACGCGARGQVRVTDRRPDGLARALQGPRPRDCHNL